MNFLCNDGFDNLKMKSSVTKNILLFFDRLIRQNQELTGWKPTYCGIMLEISSNLFK